MFDFEGERRRCYAMPLGGLGTGNLAICGDGSLRQWQIHNKVNHVGFLPHSFFAVRWMEDHRPVAKLLQTDEFWNEPDRIPPPTISDHFMPPDMKMHLGELPKVASTKVRGCYPITEIEYDLGNPNLELKLKAWNPLVPQDSDESSWPVAVFEFEATNKSDEKTFLSLLSTLQNAVGWDGATLIHGVEHPAYGGNRNTPSVAEGQIAVSMDNPLVPEDHPGKGEMMHCGLGQGLTCQASWTDVSQLWNSWSNMGKFGAAAPSMPSPQGKTCNSALSALVQLEPGETKEVTFIVAWHFPNRYVDWWQWESVIPNAQKSRFFLGNHYALRGAPSAWMPGFLERIPTLRLATQEYIDTFSNDPIGASLSSTVANLRTNICLWTEDGRFYGFEGGHGASTWEGFHAVGGCCPMNCTHVWNYEQGLRELWPDLFRTMRETDWLVNLSPAGQLPHRVTLPVYVKKLWGVNIGGPENPAFDGLFAAILKTYQSAKQDVAWLESVWPSMQQAMRWIMVHADDRGDGVLRGEQPNTYDIHLYGPNTFIGSQYLASLRAMEEMAKLLSEDPSEYRGRFEVGAKNYDEICFNGEYYVQRIPEDCKEPYQFGDGCAADQLLGQWWAHHVGLGYVLPQAHVKSACQAIFKRNFRRSFKGFKQEPRIFAGDDDSGLLTCTYENGQRPQVPLLYSDEVWTGIEYAFAALCLSEGMESQAMELVGAVRSRYDGSNRNPFNEVECGDHYIRSLSAWSLRD